MSKRKTATALAAALVVLIAPGCCATGDRTSSAGSSIGAAKIDFGAAAVNITRLELDAGRGNEMVSVSLQAGPVSAPRSLDGLKASGMPLLLADHDFAGEREHTLLEADIDGEPWQMSMTKYTVVVVISYVEDWWLLDTLSLDVWVAHTTDLSLGEQELRFEELDL
jgi:hypothetical protein